MGKGWIYTLRKAYIPRITRWLNRLPNVKWDRITLRRGHLFAFGWIDREKDSYKDFFIIDFARGKPVDYCSSNTIYNLKYSKILGLYSQKCERIEDIFKGVRNSIKLNEDKKNAKQENT